MKPLYKVADEIKKCFVVKNNDGEYVVNEETGEIFDKDYLDQLQMDKEKKVDGIVCWIKDLQAEADACRHEEESFAERRKSAEKKIQNLKDYLTYWVAGEKFSTEHAKVSWRKSVTVNILNEEKIPKAFVISKTVTKPDKKALKEALSGGREIPGAELVTNQNIQIK